MTPGAWCGRRRRRRGRRGDRGGGRPSPTAGGICSSRSSITRVVGDDFCAVLPCVGSESNSSPPAVVIDGRRICDTAGIFGRTFEHFVLTLFFKRFGRREENFVLFSNVDFRVHCINSLSPSRKIFFCGFCEYDTVDKLGPNISLVAGCPTTAIAAAAARC